MLNSLHPGKASGTADVLPADRLIFANEAGERLTTRRVSENFRYLLSTKDGLVDLKEPPPRYAEDGTPNWFKTVGFIVWEAEYRGSTVYVVYEQIWGVPCCTAWSHTSVPEKLVGHFEWATGSEVRLAELGSREDTLFEIDPIGVEEGDPSHPLAGMTFVPVDCREPG